MAKDLYDRAVENEKKAGGKKNPKIIAAVLIILVVLAGVIGLLLYSGIGATIFGERIANSDQAANALSGLGNDIGGMSKDLKDIENQL